MMNDEFFLILVILTVVFEFFVRFILHHSSFIITYPIFVVVKNKKVMLRRNDLFFGLGIGIFVPMLTFFFLFGITEFTHLPFKTRTIAIFAVCANMILLRFYNKYRALQTTNGVMYATFALAVVWIFWFYQEIAREVG